MKPKILRRIAFAWLAAPLVLSASPTSIDDIQLWAGTGTNLAAMVIHWSAPEVRNDTEVPNPVADKSLAWGFRWNGQANAEDMFNAILSTDPRLFAVANRVAARGKAILGLGYDLNNNRVFGLRNDTNILAPDAFTNGLVAVSSESSDIFRSLDAADLYWGGWFGPSWEPWHEQAGAGGFTNVPSRGTDAFWTPADLENPYAGDHGQWHYAEFGLAGINLKDHSWIGFSVAAGGLDFLHPNEPGTVAWGLHKQAPAPPSAAPAFVSPFAAAVIASEGPFGAAPYDDPSSLLGMPATRFYDLFGGSSGETPVRRVKLVEAAYNLDPTQTRKLITTFDEGSSAIVEFDQPVVDHPAHPYGIDFLVFGNVFFGASDFVSDEANMNTLQVAGPTFDEPLKVSVSPGFTGQPGEEAGNPLSWPWYRYDDGPYGDTPFPTQGFIWDRAHTNWSAQPMDFTKPVNPSLAGLIGGGALSGADAIDLYAGSGGGTGFDLAESGFASIRFVRLEGVSPDWFGGEIDALAAVRPMALGESLTIAPENLANGTPKLFFQEPAEIAATVVSIHFKSVSDVAQIIATRLDPSTDLAALGGTVLDAVEINLAPVLGSNAVIFAADLSLAFGGRYAGNGLDLDTWRWSGTNWGRVSFAFDTERNGILLEGITTSAAFAVIQVTAPKLDIRPATVGYELRFAPVAGWNHRLERTMNFFSWTELAEVTPTNAQTASFVDPAPPAEGAFYRLRLIRR